MKFSLPWLSRATKQNKKRSNPLDDPAVSLSSIDGWAWIGDGGRGTDAGEVINDLTALKISTVYSCVRVLSNQLHLCLSVF
jgi:phage portal protein BeeE